MIKIGGLIIDGDKITDPNNSKMKGTEGSEVILDGTKWVMKDGKWEVKE